MFLPIIVRAEQAYAVSAGPLLDYKMDYRPLFEQREDGRKTKKYQIS
jgi:hypothetical protein